MKKILSIIIISLLLSSVAMANQAEFDKKFMKDVEVEGMNKDK